MIKRIGTFSVGALFPSFLGLLVGLNAQLRGQLAGHMKVSAQLAIDLPSVDAQLKAAAQLLAQLQLRPPGVRFSLAANAQLIASIQAQLALMARLQLALGGAVGIDAYEYDGTAAAFGAEVAAETAGGFPGGLPSDHVQALVLATRYPALFDALRTILLP